MCFSTGFFFARCRESPIDFYKFFDSSFQSAWLLANFTPIPLLMVLFTVSCNWVQGFLHSPFLIDQVPPCGDLSSWLPPLRCSVKNVAKHCPSNLFDRASPESEPSPIFTFSVSWRGFTLMYHFLNGGDFLCAPVPLFILKIDVSCGFCCPPPSPLKLFLDILL